MEGLTITHQDQGGRGEYQARPHGSEALGRLTYRRDGDTVVADHTLVPHALRGQGIAAKLVEALVTDARQQGLRIVPACSYVEAAFRRHPEWADLKA